MSPSEIFRIYVRAYGRHFFRTALWVTLICLALFGLLLLVPQAGELILSQAAEPAAQAASAGGFFWRFVSLNVATALLAISIWASARILIQTEISAEVRAYTSLRTEEYSETPEPGNTFLHDRAARQAAIYVPRQLGLSVFLILQLAAAGSISMQGYWLPVALMLLWLFILMMGLLRLDDVAGEDLRGWWKGLVVVVFLVGCAALWCDMNWLEERSFPLVSSPGSAPSDEDWLRGQLGSVYRMGGFVLLACLMLFLAAGWITKPGQGGRNQACASVLTAALIPVVFYVAKLESVSVRYWAFFIVQSLLAVGYWFVLMHGHYLRVWAAGLVNRFRPARKLNELTRNHVWLFTAGCIGSVTILLALWAALGPLSMGGYLGAVGIVLMFFAYIVLVVAWLQARVGKSSWRLAVPAGSVGVFVLSVFFAWPTLPQPAPAQALGGKQEPVTVRQHLGNLPADGPLFAIAAHGGGVRAALYTAAFVAWLDHETNHQFSARLIAASGASGGSVGLAVWSAANKAGCKDLSPVEKGNIPACVNAVNETLAQDHLAPLIASGLFRDYLQFFAEPARGDVLQDSIRKAAAKLKPPFGKTMADALDAGLHAAAFPLMLNSSIVGTAQPLSFTTREGMLPTEARGKGEHVSYVQSNGSPKISLLTAAMHSARFPLISPKSLVDDSEIAVVDGGYFDNSGIAVLRQHLMAVLSGSDLRLPNLRERLVVISLDSEPISSLRPASSAGKHNSFDEVLGTIIAARGAHGQAAWHQLCNQLDSKRLLSTRPGAPLWDECEWASEVSERPGDIPLWQRQREARAPALGWHLSGRSAVRVTQDAREKAMEIATRLELRTPASTPPDKGVTMQRMAPN